MPEIKARTLFIEVSLLLGVLLLGCWPAKQTDLPGQYVVEGDWGKSVLDLRTDGSFVEEAMLKNGGTKRVEGKWKFMPRFNVSRAPCLRIDHSGIAEDNWDGCNQSVNGYGIGHVEISLDPDFGVAYRK
jgi:hypothetical protein